MRRLNPSQPAGRLPAHRAWDRLWSSLTPYAAGQRRRLVSFAAATFVAGLLEATLLFVVVRLATAIASGSERLGLAIGPVTLEAVGISTLFVVGLTILVLLVAVTAVAATVTARMSMAAVTAARHRTFEAFLAARWSTQSRERAGHLQELLGTDAKKIGQAVVVATDAVTALLSFTALIASAVIISPLAAGTILVGVVGLSLLLRPVTRLTRTRSRQHASENLVYAGDVSEAVAMAREIRAFHVGEPVRQRLATRVEEVARTGFTTKLLAKLTPKLYLHAALLLLLAGMAGVWLADAGDVTQLGAVVLLLVRALTYSQELQAAIQQANEMAPYVERLSAAEARYRSDASAFGDVALSPVERIRFRGVHFGYEPQVPVLRGLDFDVRRGETIGIVGPSGSGKSTLVQLLLGLRSPDQGVHEVNGSPADRYDARSWFAQHAFVPQDNHLLSGTVTDNIAFHRVELGRDDVERAARAAHLHGEILALPHGYDTVVGPGGMDLSGGQRQRLGLARALAGGPSVLVLDEPTSALDMRSEALVQETLEQLHGSLTLFIVAHRVSTLNHCDRIMVLRDGRIEQFAPAVELLTSNDFYREVTRLASSPGPDRSEATAS